MALSDEETTELEVDLVKHNGDKALLLEIDGVEYWLPKSAIEKGGDIDADAEKGAEGTVIVATWWARDRGLL
jgi:hypothetical protein